MDSKQEKSGEREAEPPRILAGKKICPLSSKSKLAQTMHRRLVLKPGIPSRKLSPGNLYGLSSSSLLLAMVRNKIKATGMKHIRMSDLLHDTMFLEA